MERPDDGAGDLKVGRPRSSEPATWLRRRCRASDAQRRRHAMSLRQARGGCGDPLPRYLFSWPLVHWTTLNGSFEPAASEFRSLPPVRS